MPTFLEGLKTAVQEGYCSILGNLGNELELFKNVTNPFGIPQVNLPRILYTRICPLSPPSEPITSPPFTGGQCPGLAYRVAFTDTATAIPGNPSGAVDFTASDIITLTGKINGSGGTTVGQNRRGVIFSDGATDGRTLTTSGNVNSYSSIITTITSVTRVGGVPDTCGDPPIVTPPYTPGGNTYTTNNTYNNDEGISVTIPVLLVFGYATVNVDGTISIPINANFTANPEFNFNFDFNLNTGGLEPQPSNPNSPIDSPCSDPGGYTPDPTIPAPPVSIPDAPPVPPATDEPTERQRLLKGCIVTTTMLDGNETTIFQQENPDIYVPAVGYVQFRIRVGNASAWTTDLPVKSLRAFIPCSWDAGAIEVKGTPRFGNQFTVTPVYVTRTFNPTYPPES